MIRINLMPFEERSVKARKPQSAKKSAAGMLLPMAIIAGVLVFIVGAIVQQQAQVHLLASEVARVESESRALAPQIAMVERLAHERADLDMRLSLIDQLSHGRFDSVRHCVTHQVQQRLMQEYQNMGIKANVATCWIQPHFFAQGDSGIPHRSSQRRKNRRGGQKAKPIGPFPALTQVSMHAFDANPEAAFHALQRAQKLFRNRPNSRCCCTIRVGAV
jgi:hypothetical protein